MIMGGEVYLGDQSTQDSWRIGRELDLQIAAHILSPFGIRPIFDRLAAGIGGTGTTGIGADNLFIHMTGMSDAAWARVKQVGAQVSIAFPIEMNMRHGMPPIIRMQQMGLEPSLSTDVEVTLTADFFTQMRSAMNLQRMIVNQQTLDKPNGNFNLPDPRNWELPQTAVQSPTTRVSPIGRGRPSSYRPRSPRATRCATPRSTAQRRCGSTRRPARSLRARRPTSSSSTPPRSTWRRSTTYPARWSR